MEGKWKSIRNIFIIFLVSGLWHGANWTFIFWGLFHSILFLPSFIFNTNRKYTSSIIAENTFLPSPKEFIQVGVTFISVTIGWVFFRNETIGDSFNFLNQMVVGFDLNFFWKRGLVYIITIVLLEYLIRYNERIDNLNTIVSHLISIIIISVIIYFSIINSTSTFIYFQF